MDASWFQQWHLGCWREDAFRTTGATSASAEYKGDKPTSPRREDFAEQLGAFADARGGILLRGVADDGQIQGMPRKQMEALDRMLVEVSTDPLQPALRINVHHRELDNRAFVLVEVPKGDAVHEHSGRSFIRVGASNRRMDADERLRLSQSRAQRRYLWFDQQIVPQTGFESLDERLWEPLISVAGAANPPRALMNIHLLAQGEAGVDRATVAGVLLCAKTPQQWLPQATLLATHYRGRDRALGRLETQEISAPITAQITEAVEFVSRNMRVDAHKTPEREETPQYSIADETSLILSMPAAKLELVPADATVTVHSEGEPVSGAEVLALSPNRTWQRAITDEAGEAALNLYTAHLPMTVYAAAPKYAASLKREWIPNRGGLPPEINPLPSGGSVIFSESPGHLPGLRGRFSSVT